MKAGLALWFVLVILAMLAVTTWASLQHDVVEGFLRVVREPWGLATLMDAYFAFAAFGLWVAWKEACWASRLAWLVAIALLGNFAMAAYVLLQLRRSDSIEDLLAGRRPCSR